MVISKQQQEWIDKYLKDELDEDHSLRFQNELSKNKDFKNEFIFQQSLYYASKLDDVQKLISHARIKNTIASKEADPRFKTVKNSIDTARSNNSKGAQQKTLKRWLFVAASVLIIGFIGLTYGNRSDLDQELISYFQDINYSNDNVELVQEVSGRDDAIKSKLDKLQKAQTESRFSDALTLIQDLSKQQYDYDPSGLLFYEASIYAQMPDYDSSLARLDNLISQNTKHKYEARWLRSLIYLKKGENKKAKADFEILVVHSDKYKTKAQEKLKKYF